MAVSRAAIAQSGHASRRGEDERAGLARGRGESSRDPLSTTTIWMQCRADRSFPRCLPGSAAGAGHRRAQAR